MIFSLCIAALFLVLPEPVHIDSTRVHSLLSAREWGQDIPASDDWSVLGPVGDSAVLLVQGTEFAKVPWSDGFASSAISRRAVSSGSEWDGFCPTTENLRRWTAPPSGFAARLGATTSNSPGTFPTTEWFTGAEGRYGWEGWVSAGLGARWDRLKQTPRVFHLVGDSSLPSAWSWMMSVCGPGLCLEMEHHALPVGSHSWRQPGLDSLLRFRQPGSFWKVSGDSTYFGAWERRLVAHIGVLEYRVSACPGLWSGSVQSLGLRDLPAGWTSFGAGETWTSYGAATWLEFALGPAAYRLPRLGGLPWSLEVEPVRVRLDYRDFHQFCLSVQATASIPDPISAFGTRIHP